MNTLRNLRLKALLIANHIARRVGLETCRFPLKRSTPTLSSVSSRQGRGQVLLDRRVLTNSILERFVFRKYCSVTL